MDSVDAFCGGESMPINLAMTPGLCLWPSFVLKEMSSWVSFLIGVLWLSPDFGYCFVLQEYC